MKMMLLKLNNVPLRGVRILKFGPGVVQVATLTGRGTRGEPLKLPKPFPYHMKKFNFINSLFDSTIVKTSQENARIIAVEGPIGVGKSAFCKCLAEQFDMHYLPQPTMDSFYVLPSGYDLRDHDDELPERLRSYDHKNFCVDPKNVKAGMFQIRMMYLKFHEYLDAVCHLLNTGQGVVIERNFFSDYVFMKAMFANKYVSRAVHDVYFEILKNTSVIFPRPHLIVYLDIPVPVVQERIRTRNYSYEQNSPALTTEYLKSLEKFWKQDYLKTARERSEVLVYDWTDGGDVDVVIDDIEKLDLNIVRGDRLFIDWWYSRSALLRLRKKLTNSRYCFDKHFYYRYHQVEDLFIPEEIQQKWETLIESLPECRFDKGYNHHMGDGIFSILFKMHAEDHRCHKFYLMNSADYN